MRENDQTHQIGTEFWTGFRENELSLMKEKIRVEKYPFLHLTCEDFFTAEALELITLLAERISPEHYQQHQTGYRYAGFPSTEFFRFIYGQHFTGLIQELIGKKIKRCEAFPFPQVYRFPQSSKGLVIHNDFNEDRDLAMIFYIQSGWHPGVGGELCLYIRRAGVFEKVKMIAPQKNTLAALTLNENSWHGVANVNNAWQRTTLIVDWEFL